MGPPACTRATALTISEREREKKIGTRGGLTGQGRGMTRGGKKWKCGKTKGKENSARLKTEDKCQSTWSDGED